MQNLEHLLQPIKIRSMELKNRLVMPPMGTGLGNADGTVSEATLAFFKRRVQSGAGLYITEIVSVHPHGTLSRGALEVYDDIHIPGLKKLVDAAHSAGARIALQLHHAGRESLYQLRKGTAISPSGIPSIVFRGNPREMTMEDIKEVIKAFASGAVRAREAGFDAVELHGAHGYLLAQFLSLHSNRREDKYGGNMKNRARFLIECIQEVRKSVGDDFPISLRISAEEIIRDGYSIEDIQEIAPLFVEAGIDIIHASFGTHGSPGGITQATIEYPQGFKVGLARKIKEVVEVPVIGVGRFSDPYIASEAIARGDADLIAVARQHLADPDFLKNAMAGHPERTYNCLACNKGCIERLLFQGKSVRCVINPETGQETLYPTEAAGRKFKVWVIGGGPAGLTAASEAARLGHQVMLFEKEEKVGGQIQMAANVPYKGLYGEWINVLKNRALSNGAVIKTGSEVSEDLLLQENPEAVILASGGQPVSLAIEGIDLPLVIDAWKLLQGEKTVGEQVIVVGGGLTGMEVADFAFSKGAKRVTVVEQREKSPLDSRSSHVYMLKRRLKQADCSLMFGTELKRIEEGAVIVHSNGLEQSISPVDQVIIAVGTKPENRLASFLENKGFRYYLVGDAASPRSIMEAVDEGARAAWDLSKQ